MIINSGTIREAFQSFNTVFNKAFHEMERSTPAWLWRFPARRGTKTTHGWELSPPCGSGLVTGKSKPGRLRLHHPQ